MTKFTVLILLEEIITVFYKMMHTPEEILANKYTFKIYTILCISQMTCVTCGVICAFFIPLRGVLGF